jgi:hypothetical protein
MPKPVESFFSKIIQLLQGPNEQLSIVELQKLGGQKLLDALKKAQLKELPPKLAGNITQIPHWHGSQVFTPEEQVYQYLQHAGKTGPIEIGGFRRVPMIDIDTPNMAHFLDEYVTAGSTGQALEQIMQLLRDKKVSSQRIYLTPGGVRSFELGEQMSPQEWWAKHDVGDPGYRKLSSQPRVIGGREIPSGFTFRASPKLIRKNDFVAALLGTVSRPGAKKLAENERLVGKYHDRRISQNVGKTQEAALKEQLATILKDIPKPLREQVLRRYLLAVLGAAGVGLVAGGTSNGQSGSTA